MSSEPINAPEPTSPHPSALAHLERELEGLGQAKAQQRSGSPDHDTTEDGPRWNTHGDGLFTGRLVAIEDARSARDLTLLAAETDWQPAPMEMIGFSVPAPVRQARPRACPQYSARLEDVRVVAGMAVVLDAATGEIVSDSVARRRMDLSVEWYSGYGLDVTDPARSRCRPGDGTALRVERAVSLFSWENRNYAHWLLEKLASMCWISTATLPADTKLLVESGLPEQVVESLRLFWPVEHILFVERGTPVDVGELHYFSDACEIWEPRAGHVFDGSDYRICPEAIRWLAGAVRARIPPCDAADDQAYLVRPAGGNGRGVVDQGSLIKMLGDRGHAGLHTARMSFQEQVARFSALRQVVSPSGAALANLLWMRRGSTAVVLAVDALGTCYWFYHSLAAALGIRLVFYPVHGVPHPHLPSFHWNTEIPLLQLADWLDQDRARRQRSDVDVTVAVMSYNNADYIAETVGSVLAQTGVNLEVIVRDDASTDASLERLAAFARDPRFRLEVNPHNLGMVGNVNRCLASGSGRYLVVLGSDDVMRPGHLASLVAAMDAHPDAALGYTQCDWIDGNGELLRYLDHPGHLKHSYYGGRNEVADLLSHDDYITPSAMMLRRDALERIRLPDGSVHADMPAGDWDLVVRLAEVAPDFVFLRQPSIGYRVHDRQISQGFYASTAPLENHVRILEGVVDRGHLERIRGREDTVRALLLQRLAQYPDERGGELGKRVQTLCRQLDALRGNVVCLPLFSIVLTTYNRPALLRDALDSIGRQTLKDFEVILVNDHGQPVEDLLGERDFPITYVRQGRNQGPAAARNAAHRLAAGRHVVYLDDDDLFLPCHLQVLADALAQHPGEVVYTDALFLTEKIEDGVRHVLEEEKRYRHGRYSRQRLSVDNYIPVNTFAWPSALMAEVGGFDESLSGLEDWDFLLRLASKARFHHVPRETVQVRMRAESGERRSEHAFKDYPALYRLIYARHADLGDEEVRSQRTARLKQMGGLSPAGANEALEQWRARRIPDDRQRQRAGQWIESQGRRPRIGLLTLDRQAGRLQARMLAAEEPAQAGDAGQGVDLDTSRPGAAFNAAIAAWDVDWLVVADAGTEFAPGGLLRLRMELAAQPQLRALYADEWYRDDAGVLAPTLRPDLNLDLLLGNPTMLAGHWVFRRDVVHDAGGFNPEAGDAAELDLILRLIQKDGFEGIAHLPEPLLTCAPPRFDVQAQQRTILRHLYARGYAGATVESAGTGLYRIRYGHEQQPAVSLVVAVAADTTLAALERCVVSLLEKTGYPNYELLLVDNGASAQTRQWMQQVEALAASRVRAFAFDPPLSHAAACNVAATQAAGEFLLFLRPEVAALQPQWLDELLNHGLRPEVGIVGAKTISADGKVTHAGLVPGLLSSGGRAFAGSPMDAPGYMNRLQVAQDYSAVADSCLLIGKTLFAELDGFDHAAFADEGADVDLCLRARERGYLTVWTPNALLLHSVEAAPLPEAAGDALLERWLPALAHDPAYNPSLRLDVAGGFRLGESDFSWQPLPWRPVPRVLAHPADPWGSGQYRVIQPFEALKAAGLIEGALYATTLDPVEQARIDPDVVVLQRRVSDEDLERMRRMPRFSRALKIYELDDYLPNLPAKSLHREHMPRDILRTLRQAMATVDRFVVSTPALAEAFADLHPDIRVVRNRLPPGWWQGLPAPRRNTGPRPRVGWAGGWGHTGDLEMVADVVAELAEDVDWVLFGLCPGRLRPHVAEYHPGVDIEAYPSFLARLNLDLAIAPLEQNRFNECKSNLRLLEYGACAVPVVCSDVGPYRGDELPVTRVRNRHRDWVAAIREHLADATARAAAGDALRAAVHRDWMLAGAGLAEWQAAWLP